MVVFDQHVHQFSGATSSDGGQAYRFTGITRPEGMGASHIHGFYTTAEDAPGQGLAISGATGPPIAVQGGHVHQAEGMAGSHLYSFTTGRDELIGGPGGKWTQGPGPAY